MRLMEVSNTKAVSLTRQVKGSVIRSKQHLNYHDLSLVVLIFNSAENNSRVVYILKQSAAAKIFQELKHCNDRH